MLSQITSNHTTPMLSGDAIRRLNAETKVSASAQNVGFSFTILSRTQAFIYCLDRDVMLSRVPK